MSESENPTDLPQIQFRGDPLDHVEELLRGEGSLTLFKLALEYAVNYFAAGLKHSDTGVLRALTMHANRSTGNAWPSNETQARLAGLTTDRHVLYAHKRLIAKGLIQRNGKRANGVAIWWVNFRRLLTLGAAQRALYQASLVDDVEPEPVAIEQLPLSKGAILDRPETDLRSPPGAIFSSPGGDLLVTQGRSKIAQTLEENVVREPTEINVGKEPQDRDLQRDENALDNFPGSAGFLTELWDDLMADFLGTWRELSYVDRRQLERLARQLGPDVVEHVFYEALNVTTPEKPSLLLLMLEQHRTSGCGHGWRPGEPNLMWGWSRGWRAVT